MSSPRLSPIPGPYTPEADEALVALMPPGVEPLRLFRTLGNNPRVLIRFLSGGSCAHDRAIVDLCDSLHDGADVDDALWQTLSAELSPAQIVELIALAGFYHTVSYATNALRIELEASAQRFPV